MPQIKVILQKTQTATGVTGTSFGDPVPLSGALTVSVQPTVSGASALAGASILVQTSADAENVTPTHWNDLVASQTVTTNGSLYFEKANPSGNWARVKYATSSGSFAASTHIVVKGPN